MLRLPAALSRGKAEGIPCAEIMFVGGNADISFCPAGVHPSGSSNASRNRLRGVRMKKTFYFQSKRPAYFEPLVEAFPTEAILLDHAGDKSGRGLRGHLQGPRRANATGSSNPEVSAEGGHHRAGHGSRPKHIARWIRNCGPNLSGWGSTASPNRESPEPAKEKLPTFTQILVNAGIKIRGKDLRGLKLPTQSS